MTKKELKLKLESRLKFVISFLSIIVILLIVNYFIYFMGQPIKNINNVIGLSNNIEDKNLTLPLPFLLSSNSPYMTDNTYTYLEYFNLNFEEFKQVLNANYIYNSDYDCKYWTYVWTLYWKETKDKTNWELDYITTQNHIFVIVSNESGYCVLDGNEQVCLWV